MAVKTVKEIKKLIDKVILPGYTYKTNFSSKEFLIQLNDLVIKAELIQRDDKMVYEFMLDTQFSREHLVNYDEIVMINKIIVLLEENRQFVLSKFKKYTVEEYQREQELKDKQSEEFLKFLDEMVRNKLKNPYN